MTTAQFALDAVRRLSFGPETTFQNLSIVPLLAAEERTPAYLTLDEALAGGWAEIREVSDGGSVPELKVLVRGERPVLLVDGEELLGAKQNRIVNLTILLAPGRTTAIPVSCVESGRWHEVSRTFSSAPRAQFAEGRAARVRQVTESLAGSGHRTSDQGDVWELVAAKSARLNAASNTGAMSAVYDKLETPLDEFVDAFASVEGQVGAVFLVNGKIAGLDAFDAAATWRKLSPKLIRSYAVDALDRWRARRSKRADVGAIAAALASADASVFPAVGEGEDVRFSSPEVTGAALVADGRVVHINAFPAGVRRRQEPRA